MVVHLDEYKVSYFDVPQAPLFIHPFPHVLRDLLHVSPSYAYLIILILRELVG